MQYQGASARKEHPTTSFIYPCKNSGERTEGKNGVLIPRLKRRKRTAATAYKVGERIKPTETMIVTPSGKPTLTEHLKNPSDKGSRLPLQEGTENSDMLGKED